MFSATSIAVRRPQHFREDQFPVMEGLILEHIAAMRKPRHQRCRFFGVQRAIVDGGGVQGFDIEGLADTQLHHGAVGFVELGGFEQQFQAGQPAIASWQFIGPVERPEPQAAPGVHHQPQALEGARFGFESGLDRFLFDQRGAGFERGCAFRWGRPDAGGAGGFFQRAVARCGVGGPEFVDALRQGECQFRLWCGPLLFDLLFLPLGNDVAFGLPVLLHQLVARRRGHVLVPDEEVVDLVDTARFARRQQAGDGSVLAEEVAIGELLRFPHGAPRADEAVTCPKTQAEPGYGADLVDIRAAAVTGVVLVAVRRNSLAGLRLFQLEVGMGELTRGFVDEGRRAHGGFAKGELEDVVGALGRDVLEAFGEDFAHQRFGKNFGRVVRRAFGAVDAVEVQDEFAAFVDAGFAGALFDDDLAGLELVFLRFRHEPGRQVGGYGVVKHAGLRPPARRWRCYVFVLILGFRRFIFVAGAGFLLLGRADLNQVFGGKEAFPGEQAFINGTELHDTEVAVVDAADGAGLFIDAHGEPADDLLQHPVGQAGAVEQGC